MLTKKALGQPAEGFLAFGVHVSAINPHSEPILLDIAHAAAVVGVGTGVIRRWTSDGLPYIRAGRGGRKLYTKRDLERWVERLKESAA